MVTASDGSPNTVTNTPLTAPSTAPSASESRMSSGSDVTPAAHNQPSTVHVSPTTLATDRSISPVMTTSASGSAISATGMTSSITNRQNRGDPAPSMVWPATTTNSTSAT